jgi:integrase/recombinase XerD
MLAQQLQRHRPGKKFDLLPFIERCLKAEESRNVSVRSLFELNLHLQRLSSYCRTSGIVSYDAITSCVLKDFILEINPSGSPAQGKAIIWTLRKFFAYLALWGILDSNPAAVLKHPKISVRNKLPQYLTSSQLRIFLETASEVCSLQDFVIVSLLATTGARPNEIVTLKRCNCNCMQDSINLNVKGNWTKQTPISPVMSELLADFLNATSDISEQIFFNQWGNPIDVRYIQRLVRLIGETAGLPHRVSPVTLRHTFATYAADRHGVLVTRALLGHCSASHATDVYLHLSPSKYRRLMNKHPYRFAKERTV